MKLRIATDADIDNLFEMNEEFNGKNCTTKELLRISIIANEQEVVCIAYIDGAAGFICGQLFKSMCYAVNYAEITELVEEMIDILDEERIAVDENTIVTTWPQSGFYCHGVSNHFI